MANEVIRRARVDDARHDLDQLRTQLTVWLRYRLERDLSGQYRAGLDVLHDTLTGCLEAVRMSVDGIDPGWPLGEVYAECRAAAHRLALIGRVFEWYRTRFDQRDDPQLGPFLAAADEVTWSCYAQVFRTASTHGYGDGGDVAYGQVPLPFVESEYAPRALARDLPPTELQVDKTDPLLARFLDRLPLAVIGLPFTYLAAPWQLVLLGHEVGHHVQNDLVSDGALTEEFGDVLAGVAPGEAAAERWRRWGSEVFADCCLAVSAGPWALRAILELELSDQQTMLADNRVRYPPAIARLVLLSRVAAGLGLEDRLGLNGLELADLAGPQDGTTTEEDIGLAPMMAAAALRHSLGGFGSFSQLYGFRLEDFTPGGTVHRSADALLARMPFDMQESLRAPRLLAASAVQAWNQLEVISDRADRAYRRAALTDSLLHAIVASREPGVRAAAPAKVPEPRRLREDLADLLMDRVRDRPS